MGSSFWFDTINLIWSTVLYQGVTGYDFQMKDSSCQKIVFVLANSVDPAEMPHYAAFPLGLYFLPKYAFGSQ